MPSPRGVGIEGHDLIGLDGIRRTGEGFCERHIFSDFASYIYRRHSLWKSYHPIGEVLGHARTTKMLVCPSRR